VIDAAAAKGSRIWFVAHRKELIDQCSKRLDGQGVPHGVIMASHPRFRPDLPVQVCSVQTIAARPLPGLIALLGGPPDIIIVDETHLARARSYAPFFELFPGAVVIGLTATPWRLDGKGLGELYSSLVVAETPAGLEQQGFLARATGFAFDQPDLSGVHQRGGDYREEESAKVMAATTIVGNVVEKWIAHAEGRRTVGFAVNVDHSKTLVAQFCEHGVAAEHLDGTMPKGQREGVLSRIASGETRVVFNVNVLTAGWDLPLVETAILARPTKSLPLFLQMVGRAARPACRSCGGDINTGEAACRHCGGQDLKRIFRIHDHAGCVLEHGLPNDPRDYDLTSDVRKSRRGARLEEATAIRVCLACYAMFPSDLECCPACGWVNERRTRKIKHVDGEAISLEEAAGRRSDRKYVPEHEGRREYAALLDVARAKGYKDTWAGFRFRERFGFFPRNSWRE
jgi:superfamily II DNA or RNA helicase